MILSNLILQNLINDHYDLEIDNNKLYVFYALTRRRRKEYIYLIV